MTSQKLPPLPMGSVLLLGCGYLGAVMVRALAGRDSIAVTRGIKRHGMLAAAGVRCIACDLASPDLAAQLTPTLQGFVGSVFLLAPPSAWPAQNLRSDMARLTAFLRTLSLERAVLASSTAVYGDTQGACVDAASEVRDRDERTHKLLVIEQAWMAAGMDSYVVRLAGLYGPGRVIGQHGITRGELVSGPGDDYLNLLHIEDAARAMLATASVPKPLRYALISDGQPLLRRDYYHALAHALQAPTPQFGDAGGRRAGSRRCDPTSSWAALSLLPVWPDSRIALKAALLAGQ